MYLSWAVMYEGSSDAAYFDILLPRIMENLVINEGQRNSTIPATPAIRFGISGRNVESVAREACSSRDAFHIIFIHADTGGRDIEAGIANRSTAYCDAMERLCSWASRRCIVIAPRRETEAWVLADPAAVTTALGYNGEFGQIGLPGGAISAERLQDPKATLSAAVASVRGRRRRRIRLEDIYPAIAQRQSIEMLQISRSFQVFEQKLRVALQDIGCLRL